MKKLISLTIIPALLFLVLVSCQDDFLDGPAQGVLSEAVLTNQNGIEASLIATYSLLDGFPGGGWAAAGTNSVFGSMASDDAYKGSEPGDQQPMTDVELYQWGTGGVDGYVAEKWTVLYDGVNRANATMNLLGSVEEGISAEDRQRIEGETRFLRAHYHFEAYKVWENIPYYTEADEDFRKPNSAPALPLIIADMQEAINLLPETQGAVGRATKWTAKAYMGKLQVWAGDFAAAKSTLDDVVNNGPYALRDCFHDTFSAFAADENGSETVLAYQASTNDGDPNGENGNRNDRLNYPHGGSPFGCCGFHQPSQNLVNAHKVDANGLPFLDGSFNDSDVDVSTPVDPRLDWNVGRDDVPFLDWGLHTPNWIRDRAWAGPYSPKKHIYEEASGARSSVGWNNAHLGSQNPHLLRYADVLLLLAEAEVELGNLDRAREIVNQIRTRAGNCAQGPDGGDIEVPINDASITWATYQVGTYDAAWTDAATARAAVRMERRLELAMEGHRFFDLRRWGIAEQVLNDYIAVEQTKRQYLTAAAPYTARHQRYPIPSVQVELSTVDGTQNLIQNDGW